MKILIFFLFLLSSCSLHTRKQLKTYDHLAATDFHMHIHSPPKEYDDLQFNGGRALLAAESIGLNRALVLSNAYNANATEHYAQTENNFIFSEVKKKPSQLAGAFSINPLKEWSSNELKRCIKLGLKVLKLHLMASGLDLRKENDFKKAYDFLQVVQNYKLTVLIHANYPAKNRPGESEKLKQLIESFPNIRWIIGHMLGREFKLLADLHHPNFFAEISAAPLLMKTETEKEQFAQVVRKVGVEKFLFGSDWPVIHPAEELKALLSFPFQEEEFQAIIFNNANQLNDLFN